MSQILLKSQLRWYGNDGDDESCGVNGDGDDNMRIMVMVWY